MNNKIKVLLTYVVCFIATFVLSFISSEDNKNFFILISVTLIILSMSRLLKIDIKAIRKFLIITCGIMLIFSFNVDYFSSMLNTPSIKEHILSVLTILVLPFMCIYEILQSNDLLKYSIIVITGYFCGVYILSKLLYKVSLKSDK